MHDVVFICSAQDKFITEALCRHMENNGLNCLYSHRDFASSADRTSAFIDAVSSSTVAVFVYSASANHSGEVLAAIRAALQSGCTIIPLCLDRSIPDKKISDCLQTVQWLDATSGSLEENALALSSYIRIILPDSKTIHSIPHTKTQSCSPRRNWFLIFVPILLIAAAILLFRNNEGRSTAVANNPPDAHCSSRGGLS